MWLSVHHIIIIRDSADPKVMLELASVYGELIEMRLRKRSMSRFRTHCRTIWPENIISCKLSRHESGRDWSNLPPMRLSIHLVALHHSIDAFAAVLCIVHAKDLSVGDRNRWIRTSVPYGPGSEPGSDIR